MIMRRVKEQMNEGMSNLRMSFKKMEQMNDIMKGEVE